MGTFTPDERTLVRTRDMPTPLPRPTDISWIGVPPAGKVPDVPICFAANAIAGQGGQGEFLRQMKYALERFPRGRILSRRARSTVASTFDVPFKGWRAASFRAVLHTPILRRRSDLLTLISDVDFDSQLFAHLDGVKLFDGVMGQCSRTFERLERQRMPLVLTALNTHIDNVADVLAEEHRRLGIRSSGFVHPGMRKRVRSEVERAWRIRAVSEASRQSFIERGAAPEKVEVILPAVDLDYFRPTRQRDHVFRVLAVLTIDSRKGAYYLLRAFERAAIPNSELVIIGATGDRWSSRLLQSYTSRLSNVRLQRADVLKDPIEATYGQASVLVHPAIEDGFALAVAQALACGKPVITTRQTGASQLVQDGRNGYVLESRDVDGIVERLRELAQDESLLNQLSEAAPRAVAHLGYPEFLENVVKFYDRVLAA
jgi:glycosyltransferase involved in cell wall biosynthesis